MVTKKKGDMTFLSKYLQRKAVKYKHYRVVFYNKMLDWQKEIGEYMKPLMQNKVTRVDTGTARKRTDFKVLRWNQILFGIFEPDSKWFDSELHNPTGKISKYTGKVRDPTISYFGQWYRDNPFIKPMIDKIYIRELRERVERFNAKYLGKT